MTTTVIQAKAVNITTGPKTREGWLLAACDELWPLLKEQGVKKRPKVRVSVGYPKGTRGGKTSHAIGQCWHHKTSADSTREIFISPELDDAARVIDVLAHEMVHAAVGIEAGHGREFAKIAKGIGLEGRMTATVAGEEFAAFAKGLARKLGKYPHAKLSAARIAKQTTRMMKVECPDCGCIARMTRVWLERVGPPVCGCGAQMERDA